ncbi:hypothetical protein L484_017317 [Morus notabilis]|uniref:Uncharacterized protein n=1 Tax=Morus notabilis TaxID=981085 RepID=W9RSZ7_9ROSA|nr:hypothetical protein L484_017317 [Morus notabilis]
MASPNFPDFTALPELREETFFEEEMMPSNPTPTEPENAPVDNASVYNEEAGERSRGKRPRTSPAWQHFTEEPRPNPKTGEMEIRAMMHPSKNSSRQPFAHNLNGLGRPSPLRPSQLSCLCSVLSASVLIALCSSLGLSSSLLYALSPLGLSSRLCASRSVSLSSLLCVLSVSPQCSLLCGMCSLSLSGANVSASPAPASCHFSFESLRMDKFLSSLSNHTQTSETVESSSPSPDSDVVFKTPAPRSPKKDVIDLEYENEGTYGKKKPIRKSEVWDHFTIKTGGIQVMKEGEKKAKLKAALRKDCKMVSFTTDGWTSL